MDDRWLSMDEISEYLGVSKDTVYTWISAKGMPAHRVGRLWKFKRDEVDGWIARGARLVGGCCRVGPEQIATIAARVRRR